MFFFRIPVWMTVDEFRGYAYEELEVYSRHRARQHRKVIFIEYVVYGKFQLQICGSERKPFLQGDIAHVILRQMPCDGVVVARHCESF